MQPERSEPLNSPSGISGPVLCGTNTYLQITRCPRQSYYGICRARQVGGRGVTYPYWYNIFSASDSTSDI